MTTKNSPPHQLEAQARGIAAMLKKAERGEPVNDTNGSIKAARLTPSIKVGIVMDDKVLNFTIAWSTVRSTSQSGIAEYVRRAMAEEEDSFH